MKAIFNKIKGKKVLGGVILSLFTLPSLFTLTSCEDMFTAENKLVSTDLAPQDTLYQMMGIIQKMQVLADRTVLLGEVRADLVEVDPIHASADIQELAANNISTTNAYNQPADYYAVINNCNIYLAGVDSLLKVHGEYYYEKEICAVKCFRAWCYLELAKIYGDVPFVTEPVVTSDAAEAIVASGQKANMQTILDFCIDDLAKYPYMSKNDELRQIYGESYYGFRYDQFFIPVRALLAELYLWRGSYTGSQQDYINAIRMYHDYFCFPSEERGISSSLSRLTYTGYTTYYTGSVTWYDRSFTENEDFYSSRFGGGSSQVAGILPLDTVEYFGNITDIRAVFNSQYSNDYYPAVSPSQRMKNISKAQDFCKYLNGGKGEVIYGSHDANDYTRSIEEGDLRLSACYNTVSNFAESQYNGNVNPLKSYILKYTEGSSRLSSDRRQGFIPYFRITNLYLHLAEALNRAGFPETSFAVLAYGLSYDVLTNRKIISQDEFDRLCAIQSYGFTIQDAKYEGDMLGKTSGSFVIWPSTVFYNVDRTNIDFTNTLSGSKWYINVGIHSLGSGDTEFNEKYYLDDEATLKGLKADVAVPELQKLPTLLVTSSHEDSLEYQRVVDENDALMDKYKMDQAIVDSINAAYLASPEIRAKRQARVKELVLDEEALEGSFEGLRFYDILRYQMQEGKVGSTITLPDYIKTKYGDMTSDNMTGKPWYLTLPKR